MSAGNEIKLISLEIWDSDWCGTNLGPMIEITTNGETRGTGWKNAVYAGQVLVWDNILYDGLDDVVGLQAVGPYLQFRILGYHSDDFCPKRLTVKTYDGTKYRSPEMHDWVDGGKGRHIRYAYKI